MPSLHQIQVSVLFSTSKKVWEEQGGENLKGSYEVNLQIVTFMHELGKGHTALDTGTFSHVMNTTIMSHSAYDRLFAILHSASLFMAKESMAQGGIQVKEVGSDTIVSIDGTWHRRRRSSHNGVVAVISKVTGKVLDFEVLCNYCRLCEKDSDSDHSCTRNHTGSAGTMEAAGAIKIFSQSIEKYELQYLEYLDGDTSAYKKVVESKPYGEDTIEKRECIGHVQKRVRGRLRKLKEKYHGVKLSDGKTIGGRGRLTDGMINKLQVYHGLAVRGNLEDICSMQKNIMAGLHHIFSSADAPNYSVCPDDGWCEYNKDPENYQHHEGIPMCIVDLIKLIHIDLSDPLLLSRCAHGKTQNNNKSFNKLIWDHCSKEVWLGKPVVEQSISMAVGQVNDGATALVKVLKKMGIEPRHFMSKLTMDRL